MTAHGAAKQMKAMAAVKWQSVLINPYGDFGNTEIMLGLLIVVVVFRMELQRRAMNDGAVGTVRNQKNYAHSIRKMLLKFAPEAFGLLTCTLIAWWLLNYGTDKTPLPDDEASRQAWEQITRQWPLLTTADSLLSLQAFFRVVMFGAALLHGDTDGPTPMSDETGALNLAGCVARVLLLARSKDYALDGPMGGMLPWACDIACLPLAFGLARGSLWRGRKAAVATIIGVGWLSSRHCLNFADGDIAVDALFVAPFLFDFLAAVAYLARSLLVEAPFCGVRLLRHLLMATQAALAGYYFLVVDGLKNPAFVRAGNPFLVLQSCTMGATSAYLSVAAVLVAEYSVAETVQAR